MRLITCADGVTVSIFLKLAPNLKVIGVCLCFVVFVAVLACFLFFLGRECTLVK